MRRLASLRTSEDRGIPSSLLLPLRRLLEALRRLDSEVDIYLSGSYARGDWLKDSDVDLIIVSKIFAGLEIGPRYALVKKLMEPGFSLDVMAYSPSEFERAKSRSTILEDMLSYALKITLE